MHEAYFPPFYIEFQPEYQSLIYKQYEQQEVFGLLYYW